MNTGAYTQVLCVTFACTQVLFAPDQIEFLYPDAQAPWFSGVSNVTHGEQQLPLFNMAEGLETVLQPGDALYIPM